MQKAKISGEEKIQAVKSYLSGHGSQDYWAKRFNVASSSFNAWVKNYKALGPDGLCTIIKQSAYPKALKLAAVHAYINGEGSQNEVCQKYGIRSKTQLQNWIKAYNGHKELRSSSGKGSEVYMTKGRNTTYDERIEIVSYCLENGKDYAQTIEKYGISYPQIYSWVRKYEDHGAGGLLDKRGKRKSESEMTEVEKLRAEYTILEAKNRHLELENAILKKLEELERK